jgi:hypothetical protein
MAEQLAGVITTQRTHIDLTLLFIDFENKRIELGGKIGSLDADGNLMGAEAVSYTIREDHFADVANILIPDNDALLNPRKVVRNRALKLLKNALESRYGLAPDSL